MVPVTKDLEAVLLALPRAERARLAERLIASLDEDAEVEEAWQAEVKRRLERYRAGEIEAVSAASVHEEARRRLNR
jgi:putative addiction module component (TIGR02574 family)